jgi:hypothetical protein
MGTPGRMLLRSGSVALSVILAASAGIGTVHAQHHGRPMNHPQQGGQHPRPTGPVLGPNRVNPAMTVGRARSLAPVSTLARTWSTGRGFPRAALGPRRSQAAPFPAAA